MEGQNFSSRNLLPQRLHVRLPKSVFSRSYSQEWLEPVHRPLQISPPGLRSICLLADAQVGRTVLGPLV